MAYGDIKFTDDRIKREDWPARKPNIFTGKVPVLMVDGKPLPESLAIARYLARMADLVPQDSYEAARVDAIADRLNNAMTETHGILFKTEDEKEKTEKFEKHQEEVLKPFFSQLNKYLEGRQWFITNKTTWADLFIGMSMTWLRMKVPGTLDNYPNITALVDKVLAIPKIKEWNDKQPKDLPF
ncbi:hypothetical protein Pmani_033979 [Petrolisthes manimaculis]|uniref:glutathione transferase n=1 Tax=Petrolisthes manimaculis TaxID=1843537 RepID=A0AAE1NNE5_9EUCA|nr:hypothetical protein Pmani_033979 [Petrolisthes manimaculis]